MHRSLLLYIFILFQLNIFLGQNLVTNPGFETYNNCPNGYNVSSDKELVSGWRIPSPGTSDYFNRCDKTGRAGVPKNAMGYMEAKEGKGYAGVILSDFALIKKGERNYREYLQNRLLAPLEKGTVYCVKFYYCVATYSRYSVNRLGIAFSNDPLGSETNLINKTPDFELDSLVLTKQKDAWIEFCGTYLAQGGERFLTLGNFYSDNRTSHFDFKEEKGVASEKAPSKIENFAYYFVDMVSVEVLDNSCCYANEFRFDFPGSHSVETGKTYVLQNIYFAFDKYDFTDKSKTILHKLHTLMQENPQWRIEILGHTDITGPYAYNHELSLKRAGAVAQFLIDQGMDEKNVHYSGFGFQRPIFTNATPHGRGKNRRVEFRVYNIYKE